MFSAGFDLGRAVDPQGRMGLRRFQSLSTYRSGSRLFYLCACLRQPNKGQPNHLELFEPSAHQATTIDECPQGKMKVRASRPPHPCGPLSGLSAQYFTPPVMLTGWSPNFVSFDIWKLIGTDHCCATQS
jgi:hypothetical protein